jgi:hypothetical protein
MYVLTGKNKIPWRHEMWALLRNQEHKTYYIYKLLRKNENFFSLMRYMKRTTLRPRFHSKSKIVKDFFFRCIDPERQTVSETFAPPKRRLRVIMQSKFCDLSDLHVRGQI